MTEELYKRYRPANFGEVIGQDDVVRQLVDFGRRRQIPHFLLLVGPSGTGKTTVARILRKKMGCGDVDYREINASDYRGIDMVREIRSNMSLAPISGKCRMWMIDECFPAGTVVSVVGGKKPIERVQMGDRVYTVDGISCVKKVFQNAVTLDRLVRLHFSDGRTIVTTRQHRFLTEEGWVEAGDLDIGLGIYRVGDSDKGSERHGISDLLQSRHWEQETQIGNRGRWEWPSVEKGYIARQKENPSARAVRVDCVEIYKPGCNDESFAGVVGDSERRSGLVTFYDLQVAGHPSYFVEGLPVHNCHQLTSDAQNGLLKILEDTPPHCYFVLSTTDPQKLKRTIITRATQLNFRLLSSKDLRQVIDDVVEKEKTSLSDEVMDRLVDVAEGSARKALVLLHSIIGMKTEDDQLQAIAKGDFKAKSIELARLLMKPGANWAEVSALLKGMDEEVEQMRYMVLGYCRSVLLGGGRMARRAAAVIDRFQDAMYESKAAGFALACWDVLNPPRE